MPDIIFNNCVLSNFSLTGSLHILRHLYKDVAYVTDFVVAENIKGYLKGYHELIVVRNALREGWMQETTLKNLQEKDLFESLSVSLCPGEASSIAVAKVRKLVFACDDRVARREAELLGIRLTGTGGILIKAVRKNIIVQKQGDNILNQMIQRGFSSPVKSLKEM